MTLAVETTNLRKRYGSFEALKGLSLRVESGEVYGLLGPNGAGKSTLLHTLLGLLWPDGGQVLVLGKRPGSARGRVGYLPERVRYHTHFTPREYLRALGEFSSLRDLSSRCQSALELVDLTTVADRRIGAFSKGMLHRLGIAQAILGEPDLLLVDEPTSGLDPAGQREMIDLLGELRRRGQTILMCTHQIAEVETLCDRIGIMSGGKLAAEERLCDLTPSGGVRVVVRAPALDGEVGERLRALGPAVAVEGREVRVGPDEAVQRQVLRLLLDAGESIAEVRPVGSGVEQLYLSVARGRDGASGTAGGSGRASLGASLTKGGHSQ